MVLRSRCVFYHINFNWPYTYTSTVYTGKLQITLNYYKVFIIIIIYESRIYRDPFVGSVGK